MYEPSRYVDSFPVAGFKFHDGPMIFDRLKVGEPLEMVPEPDNPHDEKAIALCKDGVHIGYIPHEDNNLVALLAYFGHADVFEARIIQVDPQAPLYNQVHAAIYVKDARKR